MADAHSEVIVGGVLLNLPGDTVFQKMQHLQKHQDWLRQLLLNEPRGRAAKCTNLVVPPCHPEAEAGYIIIESDYYVPMVHNVA